MKPLDIQTEIPKITCDVFLNPMTEKWDIAVSVRMSYQPQDLTTLDVLSVAKTAIEEAMFEQQNELRKGTRCDEPIRPRIR